MPEIHVNQRVKVRTSPARRGVWSFQQIVGTGTVAEYVGRIGSAELWAVQLDGSTIAGVYVADELTPLAAPAEVS